MIRYRPGEGRGGERIVQAVERGVVADEVVHKPKLRWKPTETPCKSGPTESTSNSLTGRISEKGICILIRIDLTEPSSDSLSHKIEGQKTKLKKPAQRHQKATI